MTFCEEKLRNIWTAFCNKIRYYSFWLTTKHTYLHKETIDTHVVCCFYNDPKKFVSNRKMILFFMLKIL